MANRRKFSSSFKAKVVLEALKELDTLSALSSRFEVSQEMISRWKSEFLKLSLEVFDKKPHNHPDDPSEDVNRLRAKVG